MTSKDYSAARFYAISSIGYGKGYTAEEAVENYVETQLRNHPASRTVYRTKAKWEEALRTGEAKPAVWEAPVGTTGFVLGFDGLHWYDEDGKHVKVDISQRRMLPEAHETEIEVAGDEKVPGCSNCGSTVSWHVEYVREHGLCVS